MADKISFNINAELYESEFAELAVKLPGEKVYRNVGEGAGARFQTDVVGLLEEARMPAGWKKMAPPELSGRNWRCIARLGYMEGDPQQPAVEFEATWETLGEAAKAYLADAAPA